MPAPLLFDTVETAVGPLTIVVEGEGSVVVEVWLSDVSEALSQDPAYRRNPAATAEAARQLVEYAIGERKEFDLPLAPRGTAFQRKVWNLLLTIRYGETRTYRQLAAELGMPQAPRAVGRANATNPIGIVIPCHRVVGTSGSLTGYGGGLPMKQRLLDLEASRQPKVCADQPSIALIETIQWGLTSNDAGANGLRDSHQHPRQ